MIFKVGDEVRVHKGCKRYKTYIPEILNHKGIVVDINENYKNPIIVSMSTAEVHQEDLLDGLYKIALAEVK